MIDSTCDLFGGDEMVQAQRAMREKLNNIDNDTSYGHDRESSGFEEPCKKTMLKT